MSEQRATSSRNDQATSLESAHSPHDEPEAAFLRGEDMLDARPHTSEGGIASRNVRRHPSSSRLLALKQRLEATPFPAAPSSPPSDRQCRPTRRRRYCRDRASRRAGCRHTGPRASRYSAAKKPCSRSTPMWFLYPNIGTAIFAWRFWPSPGRRSGALAAAIDCKGSLITGSFSDIQRPV
jgi:hypothetical protein